jgi:Xaa-Pro dipeptidase
LAFSLEEYAGRLSNLRRNMAAHGVDVLLVTTSINIYYLTGYHNSGQDRFQCLIVPAEGDLHLILRKLYFTAVKGLSWTHTGTPVPDTETMLDATLAAMKRTAPSGARIGYDDRNLGLPPEILDGLRNNLPSCHLVPAGGLVEKCRVIKSPAELTYIRESCRLTAMGLEAAVAEARPGATENDLMAAAYSAMVRSGSEFVSEQPIVVAGIRNPARRGTTENRVLVEGESIWYEASASVKRYGGPIMRTITVGRPHSEVKQIHDVMTGALNALLATAKPGVTAGEVDHAARSQVQAAGLGQFWLHRAGYSVGIGFPPSWVEGDVMDLKPGDQRVLKPGMVFHTVCWLLVPHLGSIGLSETWTVTASGIEVLTHTPRELRSCH